VEVEPNSNGAPSGPGGRGGNHREGEIGRQARRVAFLEKIPEEQDNQATQPETEV
jgi:hypothetical protein